MTKLVFKTANGNIVTNSLLMAQQLGKEHSSVLKTIRTLLKRAPHEEIDAMFIESTYLNKRYQKFPMYVMSRCGFLLLMDRFDPQSISPVKQEFMDAFDAMEAQGISNYELPQTYAAMLRLAAEQAEQLEKQQAQLEEQQSKVLFADAVSGSPRSCLIAELAKILRQNGVKMGQNRLFHWLRERGYLCSRGSYNNQPTQRAMEMGLFEMKQTVVASPHSVAWVISTPKVTGKGQIYFVGKFLKTKIRYKI